MSKPIQYLVGALVFIGCVFYIYGIITACIESLATESDYKIPEVLAATVTSIATVFATNLGAVIGISVTKQDSRFNTLSNWKLIKVLSNPNRVTLQIGACYLYIISLLVCTIVWMIKDFTTDPSKLVALVAELSKSLLGAIVGALAMALNIKPE